MDGSDVITEPAWVQFGSALLGAVVGALLGAAATWLLPRPGQRRQAVIDLLARYNTDEMQTARAHAWTILSRWPADKGCIDFFLSDVTVTNITHRTECQGLVRVLAFFASVQYSLKAGLLSKSLTKAVFTPYYQYYRGFFLNLRLELESKHLADRVIPSVLEIFATLDELDRLLVCEKKN